MEILDCSYKMFYEILDDIKKNRYTDTLISFFVLACYSTPLTKGKYLI